MKTLLKYTTLLLFVFSFISCEDTIDVPLDTAEPKLVIDASIKWQKGTPGNEQRIKLTTTTNYYSNVIPTVSGATVFITNSTNVIFTFTEIPTTGEYICTDFIPVINETYILTVIHDGQTYKATDTLFATPDIDSVEQTTVPGFEGDIIQVKFFYQDNGAEDNFYLVGAKNSNIIFPEYGVIDDEFFQGNQMFGFYTHENLKAGDHLDFSLQGISERYANYMEKLITISGAQGGNPFATPPATLRGNIVNQTNQDDFPFGYFSLSEIDTLNYTVQ
ncbi:lipoprotein precursor [Flavobacterium limnosediminis JC2902]|uniref:Lipoprotein n=1 Tax=Flavobacterium limnosediminis JC2902 TaxID=1341181 RepID=V6SRJ8_9FLAO|nr:DUF4249 domain-containing protein [Flavobacterium limnosediminis]ESU28807.1 lipoprotein precursor [Flavobacterium limnosediminis JC2902]